MRATYRGLSMLIVLGVVLQAVFIAFAWFTVISDVDSGLVIDKDYDGNAGHAMHSIAGMMVIPLLGLALFIVSFLAKIPEGVKWAGFVLLAIIAQVALAFIAFGVPAVGALHGLNAFVVLVLALRAARQAGVPVPGAASTTETAAV